MIIPMRWQDVKTGARVVDPAGQVFHVLPRMAPWLAQVRARDGRTYTLTIDPRAYVPTMLEPHDIAISSLARTFPGLEYLGERS